MLTFTIALFLLAPSLCFAWIIKKRVALLPALVFFFSFNLIAVTLYAYFCNYTDAKNWVEKGEKTYQAKRAFAALGTTDDVIAKIKAQTERNPNDSKRWYLLGKLYLTQARFKDARNALAKAHKLAPDNRQATYLLAKTLYNMNEPKQLIEAEQLVEKNLAITKDYDNCFLAGLVAYAQKNEPAAKGYWQDALSFLEPNSEEYAALANAIQRISPASPKPIATS